MKSNFHYLILLLVLVGILISLIYESPYQYDFSNYQSLKRAGLEDWIIGSVPKTAKNIRLRIKTEKKINPNPSESDTQSLSVLDYIIQRSATAEFDIDETTLQKIRKENCPEVISAANSLFKSWGNLFGLITAAARFEYRSCGLQRQMVIDHKKNQGVYIYQSK